MISKSTLTFLSDLNKNNNREWFAENRKRYETARAEYEILIQKVIIELTKLDPIYKGLEAKSCIYRINRDIRFSPDKTLYKTHFGAFIVRGGRKNGDKFGGYYVHIEPGNNSMIAGGAYMPPAPWLNAIRNNISKNGGKFREIISAKEFKNVFGTLEGEKLKLPPKGYDRDHPDIELLKMKSYLVSRVISDKEVISDQYFDIIIKASKVMKPLNDFLSEY
jgi:uncharacterized protein (TIGR02453 family)